MMEMLHAVLLQGTFLTSGIVFASAMEKKEPFRKRFGFSLAITFCLLIVVYLLKIEVNVFLLLMTKSLFSVILMVFFLHSCWEMSWTVAIYDAIWAMALWLMLCEDWQVIRVLILKKWGSQWLFLLFFFGLLFAFGHCVCAYTIAKWMPKDRKEKLGPRQMTSAILIYLLIQMLAMAPSVQTVRLEDDNWKVIFLSQIMCIIILYMQNELFKKSEIKQELELMNLLWKKEQEQYRLTKENIALINQKSHDLKHQIRALRKATKEEFKQYLDEIEESVLIYESIVKTGNDVFDTILTEKSLYCKDREIQVTCVADGSQMDFINTVDLYAILGNAMDNAIEAVEKFEDKEKRQIDVLIYRQQNFLVMNFINPMPERLIYDEELPITTKGDKKLHGFGLRSIKYIAKKYEGVVNISEEDGCFSLKILMPIPNIAKS